MGAVKKMELQVPALLMPKLRIQPYRTRDQGKGNNPHRQSIPLLKVKPRADFIPTCEGQMVLLGVLVLTPMIWLHRWQIKSPIHINNLQTHPRIPSLQPGTFRYRPIKLFLIPPAIHLLLIRRSNCDRHSLRGRNHTLTLLRVVMRVLLYKRHCGHLSRHKQMNLPSPRIIHIP